MGDIDTPEHSVTNLRLIAKWLADDGLTDPAAFLVRLASKLPELEQDAARMDWLDDVAHCADWVEFSTKRVIRAEDGAEFHGDTWRAAIDAARKEKGHG